MSRFRVIPAQQTTLTREEMYKLIRSPIITEKSTAWPRSRGSSA
jgi:hypothetical protein